MVTILGMLIPLSLSVCVCRLQKRKYLQGKRGFLKPPFRLPDYIEATGITKIREAQLDSIGDKSMRQKQRDRMRPKRGKIAIDYQVMPVSLSLSLSLCVTCPVFCGRVVQVLHDAFFRHQTEPNFSRFGDLYFEGKEFEVKYRGFKPGYISDKLKRALGMTVHLHSYVSPPHKSLVISRLYKNNDHLLQI